MATKVNGKATAEKVTKANFKEQAKARAHKSQAERVDFVQRFGKQIAAAWAKLGDKANVMAISKTLPDAKVRLVDYATVVLGLRESKDSGLINWMKADSALTHTAATPAPKKGKGKHEAA
jgi:hypothetical protein